MNEYKELALHFQSNPSEPPCYTTCACCREAEIKSILKSVETDVRIRLERGDKYVGMGPLAK